MIDITKKKIIYSRFIAGVLILVFLSVITVMVVKNVLYEGLGIENAFVHFLLDGGTFKAGDDMGGSDAGEPAGLHPDESHVDINWEVLYPFDDWDAYGWGRNSGKSWGRLDFYRAAVDNFEAKVGIYTGELLAFQRPITVINSKLNDLLGWDLNADVITQTNGHLAAPYRYLKEDEINEITESVADFDAWLKSRGIPLIYVNAGTKVAPDDRQMIDPGLENSNENGDRLLRGLSEKGVDTLDFRKEIGNTGRDYYDFYYRLDHHWTTDAQLWASSVLADKLNRDCGFDYDIAAFAPEKYAFTNYPASFLGSYGRIVVYQGLPDDFDRIKPKEPWDIAVTVPSRNVLRRGDYEEVFIETELLDKVTFYDYEDHLGKPDAYDCVVLGNDALTTTVNNAPEHNADKNILLIHDSFDFYLSTYLAGDTGRIDRIQLSGFKGSLRKYIEANSPDAVVIMYYAGNILPIDWRWHNSFFDLR